MKPWERKTTRKTEKRPGREAGASSCSTELSSAGKSTLARNLQLLLKEAAMIFSMDDYLAMSRGKHETALDAVRESGLPFIESFHAAIAEAARKGALVIVDHVIGESRRWIQDLLNRLDGIPASWSGWNVARMFCWSASGAALTGLLLRPMPSASTQASTAISRMISP